MPIGQPQIIGVHTIAPGTGLPPGVDPTDITQSQAWLDEEKAALVALGFAVAADASAPAYATDWASGAAGTDVAKNIDKVKAQLDELGKARAVLFELSQQLTQCKADNQALATTIANQKALLAKAPPQGQLPQGAVSTGAAAGAALAGLLVGGLGGWFAHGAMKPPRKEK